VAPPSNQAANGENKLNLQYREKPDCSTRKYQEVNHGISGIVEEQAFHQGISGKGSALVAYKGSHSGLHPCPDGEQSPTLPICDNPRSGIYEEAFG
jgi:hypothetical protein